MTQNPGDTTQPFNRAEARNAFLWLFAVGPDRNGQVEVDIRPSRPEHAVYGSLRPTTDEELLTVYRGINDQAKEALLSGGIIINTDKLLRVNKLVAAQE